MADDGFCGLVSPRIRLKNGSQIRSRKHAVGNKLPPIGSAIEIGPMVRSSSEGFDQWVFVIDQRHRALHGKTDMRNGSSVRSAGNASIISSSWANDIFVTYCCRT